MNREECLKAAEYAALADREEYYGSPKDSFKMIAELWSAYLQKTVDRFDVANMMILLKIARAENKYKDDNYIDIAGYAACAAEIAEDPTE